MQDTPASRAMSEASTASSPVCTARSCIQTPMPTVVASNHNLSIVCGLMPVNSGGPPRQRVTVCTSICGKTTLNWREDRRSQKSEVRGQVLYLYLLHSGFWLLDSGF